MPVSQAAREALLTHITLFMGSPANITDTEYGLYGPAFTALCDFTIKALSLDFGTLTGSSQFNVRILKNTVLATSIATATPGVSGTPTTVTGLDIDVDKGDVLTFSIGGSDADTDDATDVKLDALVQILRDQSDA